MKGYKRMKDIFWFSDSEPNELLIGFCHLIILPLAIITDFEVKNFLLIIGSIISGAYQIHSAAWCGCLKRRLLAVQIAVLISIVTCINLYSQDILKGSHTGWVLILAFAIWNMIRVFVEKLKK